MIPSKGTSFDACYVLIGSDCEFAIACIKTLLSLKLSVVAVVGENSQLIKQHLEKSDFSDSLASIFFDESPRPWENSTMLEILSNQRLIGINGGIEYLLPKDFLHKRCVVNLHPAPLPFNRGSHHSFWAIMEDGPMGATLHWITEGLDEGPIIAKVSRRIDPSMTAEDVQIESNKDALQLLRDHIMNIMNGHWDMSPQDGTVTKHSKKEIISASTIQNDNLYTGEYILRLSRAVCAKNNGFIVNTEKGMYKVVIASIFPLIEKSIN